MRRANRKDTVHSQIVEGLRARGVIVFDMPAPGDVLCLRPESFLINGYGYHMHGVAGLWMPMEFKSDKKIRGKAENISNNKPKKPTPIPTVHTLQEALQLLGMKE